MSNQARTFSRSRILLATIIGMLALFSLIYTPSPKASTRMQCQWYKNINYFTDATYTTQCGYTVYFCSGGAGHGGCFTSYTTTGYCDCEE
jgi:hypothetical protein